MLKRNNSVPARWELNVLGNNGHACSVIDVVSLCLILNIDMASCLYLDFYVFNNVNWYIKSKTS